MPPDWHDLVPGLKEFDEHNKHESPEPNTWANGMGNFGLAIAYLSVFWPEFVEIDGMVFREGMTKKDVDRWLEHTKNDKYQVEWVVNHVHLLDLHDAGQRDTATAKQLIYLGRTLREMLACKLQCDFPNKKFIVEFLEDNIEDLIDYQVSFYQSDYETN